MKRIIAALAAASMLPISPVSAAILVTPTTSESTTTLSSAQLQKAETTAQANVDQKNVTNQLVNAVNAVAVATPIYEYDPWGNVSAYTVTSPDGQRTVRIAFILNRNVTTGKAEALTGYVVQVKNSSTNTTTHIATMITDGAIILGGGVTQAGLSKIEFTNTGRAVAVLTNSFVTNQYGYSSERMATAYIMNTTNGTLITGVDKGRYFNRMTVNAAQDQILFFDNRFAVTASGNGSGTSRIKILNLNSGAMILNRVVSTIPSLESVTPYLTSGFRLKYYETAWDGSLNAVYDDYFGNWMMDHSVYNTAGKLINLSEYEYYSTGVLKIFVIFNPATHLPIYSQHYAANGNLETKRSYDPKGRTIEQKIYNPNGAPCTALAPDCNLIVTYRYAYDPNNGKMTQRDAFNPAGKLIGTIIYNAVTGLPTSSTNYNPLTGHPTSATYYAPNGKISMTVKYDANGRVIEQKYYNSDGAACSVTMPDCNLKLVYTYVYDASGKLIIRTEYDAITKYKSVINLNPLTGKPVSSVLYAPNGMVNIRTTFDSLGRMTEQKFYNPSGDPCTAKAPDCNLTLIYRYTYISSRPGIAVVRDEYSPAGILRSTIVTNFYTGRISSATYYDLKGILIEMQFFDTQGRLTLKSIFDPNLPACSDGTSTCSLVNMYKYFYDTTGKLIRREKYNSSGVLIETINY